MTLAWIPNSLTIGNLLLGFISLIFSSFGTQQGFIMAGLLILGAALLDGLDGKVARALKVDGPLGKELDSLADCVAFGVAPGYLGYNAYLANLYVVNSFGIQFDLGVLIAAIFPICAAYRLARFNVSSDPNSFSGLPSPLAGIIIALIPIYFTKTEIPGIVVALVLAAIGILMVSTVKYSKPNSYFFQNIQGIKLVALVVGLVLVVIFFRQWTVFIFIFFYVISGLISFTIQFIQEHRY